MRRSGSVVGYHFHPGSFRGLRGFSLEDILCRTVGEMMKTDVDASLKLPINRHCSVYIQDQHSRNVSSSSHSPLLISICRARPLDTDFASIS